MRKIEITIGIGLVGCRRTIYMEVDDEASDFEIDEGAWHEALERIEYSWKEVE